MQVVFVKCCCMDFLWFLSARTDQFVVTWRWHTHTHNCFTALFPGPPGWAGARRELDFMVQGKINRGRHSDHLAGRHSIRTNQYPPPPSPMTWHWNMWKWSFLCQIDCWVLPCKLTSQHAIVWCEGVVCCVCVLMTMHSGWTYCWSTRSPTCCLLSSPAGHASAVNYCHCGAQGTRRSYSIDIPRRIPAS